MTNRQIFNRVSKHLLDQNETCMSDSICRYRYNGLSCSVGCLIPDDLYNPKMEGKSVNKLLQYYPKLKKHFDLQTEGLALLVHLQDIHDSVGPKQWAGHLKTAEKHYGL